MQIFIWAPSAALSPSSCIHIHLPVVLNFHSQQAVFWIKTATRRGFPAGNRSSASWFCLPMLSSFPNPNIIIVFYSFYGKKVKDKPPRGMCYACGLVSGCSLPRLIAVQHPPPTRRLLLHCPTLLCGLRRPRARGYISQIHKYTRSRVSAKCRLLRRSVASVGDKRAARVPPSVCREAEISAICAQ